VPAELIESYDRLLEVLDALIESPGDRKTLVLDAIGGFERLTHEHCCQRDFQGEWSDRGFASFQKGYDLSVTYWLGVLQRLEKLKNAGVIVIMLGHVKVKMHNNPMGANFDRYISDISSQYVVTFRELEADVAALEAAATNASVALAALSARMAAARSAERRASRGKEMNREEARVRAMNCPAPSPGSTRDPAVARAPMRYTYRITMPRRLKAEEAMDTTARVMGEAAMGE
jgi:hypothetical protein